MSPANKYVLQLTLVTFIILILSSCAKKSNPEGHRLYELKCLNCHQEQGQGVGTLIPPLTDENYLKSNRENLVCLIMLGMQGQVEIKGRKYNEAMPATKGLREADLVNVLNYVGQNFGNNLKEFTLEEVKSDIGNCP